MDIDVAFLKQASPHKAIETLAELIEDGKAAPGASFISQHWYTTHGIVNGTSSASAASGAAQYTPFLVIEEVQLDALGIWLATAGDAGSLARLGIFENLPGGNQPGDLVVDGGTVSTSAATGEKTVSIDVTLAPGWYWFCYAQQGSVAVGATVSRKNIVQGMGPMGYIGSSLLAGLTCVDGYTSTGITGAFADDPTVTAARGTFLTTVAARVK